MLSQDSTEPFQRSHLNAVLHAAVKVELAKEKTFEAKKEAENAKRRALSAVAQAIVETEKAEAAVDREVENALYVAKEAIFTVHAAAVRARISCFEAQLAAGRAKFWEYEARDALFTMKHAKDRLYNVVDEAETTVTRSDVINYSLVSANRAWNRAQDFMNKAVTAFVASRRNEELAVRFASTADRALERTVEALSTATLAVACFAAAAAAA